MTTNQIAYWNLEETKRSNRENEALKAGTLNETVRSNKTKEQETARHNRVTETETERSNRATEGIARRGQNLQTVTKFGDQLQRAGSDALRFFGNLLG